MKNNRFERSPYGSAFRAGATNRDAESDWWNKSVREVLEPKRSKNLTILPPTKKPQIETRSVWLQALVKHGFAVGQLEMFS